LWKIVALYVPEMCGRVRKLFARPQTDATCGCGRGRSNTDASSEGRQWRDAPTQWSFICSFDYAVNFNRSV